MICRLLFLFLSITLGFAASSNIDFQDDDEFLSNLGTEPNSVVLASESQNGGQDEFGMVATNKPPYAAAAVGTSEAASLIQSNNNDHHDDDDDDECADNYGQSPRKMRSKRGSAICDPSTRNSPPSVQGSGHDPSTKDPEDINGGTNKKDSQRIAQPTRNFQESDCAAMPSAPTPVCAVVSEYYVRLHLVYPMSGLLAGWWQLLYARTGTLHSPPPLPLFPVRPGLCNYFLRSQILGMPVNSSLQS